MYFFPVLGDSFPHALSVGLGHFAMCSPVSGCFQNMFQLCRLSASKKSTEKKNFQVNAFAAWAL